jgi:hypothetical protein
MGHTKKKYLKSSYHCISNLPMVEIYRSVILQIKYLYETYYITSLVRLTIVYVRSLFMIDYCLCSQFAGYLLIVGFVALIGPSDNAEGHSGVSEVFTALILTMVTSESAELSVSVSAEISADTIKFILKLVPKLGGFKITMLKGL